MNSPGKGESKSKIEWNTFATPKAIDPHTFGWQWDYSVVSKTATRQGRLATLPEYFHYLAPFPNKNARWVPVSRDQVPPETGLQQLKWDRPEEKAAEAYTTPSAPGSTWRKPGPVAGPFLAHLGDGSVVTYSWYRFADQPALMNADLSGAERERMQKRVELLHRAWTKTTITSRLREWGSWPLSTRPSS